MPRELSAKLGNLCHLHIPQRSGTENLPPLFWAEVMTPVEVGIMNSSQLHSITAFLEVIINHKGYLATCEHPLEHFLIPLVLKLDSALEISMEDIRQRGRYFEVQCFEAFQS